MSTLCGGQGGKNGFKDGDGGTALFNFPYGLAWIEETGVMIVSESDNHCLRGLKIQILDELRQ